MYSKTSMAILSAVTLSACGGGGGGAVDPNPPQSSFATPTATGFGTSDLVFFRGDVETDGTNGGYAYLAGTTRDDERFVAQAGLLPGTSFATAPTTGTVIYTGDWEASVVDETERSAPNFPVMPSARGGNLVLIGDFDRKTLKGSSGGLTVDGDITGSGLSGTVTLEGTSGTLTGGIDNTRTIGIFHGADANTAFAGGFIAK